MVTTRGDLSSDIGEEAAVNPCCFCAGSDCGLWDCLVAAVGIINTLRKAQAFLPVATRGFGPKNPNSVSPPWLRGYTRFSVRALRRAMYRRTQGESRKSRD